MLLQAQLSSSKSVDDESVKTTTITTTTQKDAETHTHMLDYAPAPGWTVHANKDGRLYYCNHLTRSASWLPPAEAWKCGENVLPYGWERAVDDSGRAYYINHLNKTTTYETPLVKGALPFEIPEPRTVALERSAALGFGFVAGSEKPVIVRFVTEGGPSVDKLLPGDHILYVNGEDVKVAPREHVISLIRACSATVSLVVCQPQQQQGVRKSTLLSASKRARLRNKPSRVRFAESVCVNGAPLFPPSAFSLGDICVAPMANVLKVFLENGQTKSFKYDAWTTVHDVVLSLQNKLCLTATEHFSLIVEHIKSLKRNKLTLLDPTDTLARIASRPGAHKLRCLYRIAFVPSSPATLAQQDLFAFDYLFTQCCNDVIQERFAPELQYDTALRLAALHVYQHGLANNIPASKLTIKTIEKDFGLERFVPASLLEKMKRKEVRKLIAHFLKLYSTMAGSGKQLTALQAKLHYLDLVSQLPSYGAKCFSAGPRADVMERVILISPKFGISQIAGSRNSMPIPIANIGDVTCIEIRAEDEVNRNVLVQLKNNQTISISLEERDAKELVLVLKGYYKLDTGQVLSIEQEESEIVDDLAPPYLTQHRVIPEKWSYLNQQQVKTVCFSSHPIYHHINKKTNGLYNTIGRQSKPQFLSLDSNMNASISNKNHQSDGILQGGLKGNDQSIKCMQEMHQLVANSEKYLSEHLSKESEWQETSVDVESDTESELLHKLHHSDSLLLLNKECGLDAERRNSFPNVAVELLRSEINQSESDNDSIYTPHESPKYYNNNNYNNNNNSRISFGLHSPDISTINESRDFRAYFQQLKNLNKSESEVEYDDDDPLDEDDCVYVNESDIIDLTLLPPPATPDELDCALSMPINQPPKSFADSMEKLGVLHENLDLEEFLASVTVPPPTQKVTPSVELTPEEIMSFIIPPPPCSSSQEDLTAIPRRSSESNNSIEYATIDRKGSFSCCSRMVEKSEGNKLELPPRRGSMDKPPDRPPKLNERQRSQSLASTFTKSANKMEEKTTSGNVEQQKDKIPPPIPKKPPLPPVPSVNVLKSKKPASHSEQVRTAGIGSPHLQRNKCIYNEMDAMKKDESKRNHCTAVSTPTSPYLGRGAYLSAVPIHSPDDTKTSECIPSSPLLAGTYHTRSFSESNSSSYRNVYPINKTSSMHKQIGCMSNPEELLAKTDVAMTSLLVKLDQIAAQCSVNHMHGGGPLINEEKFQVAKDELTTQSLQLVHSSKMLVIAMSDPTLPDLPENLAICLTILRKLTELCTDLTNYTSAPLQTRNLILKVNDVTAAFRHLITNKIDRSTPQTIETHLAAEAERLANVLTILLRSLRIFSP